MAYLCLVYNLRFESVYRETVPCAILNSNDRVKIIESLGIESIWFGCRDWIDLPCLPYECHPDNNDYSGAGRIVYHISEYAHAGDDDPSVPIHGYLALIPLHSIPDDSPLLERSIS